MLFFYYSKNGWVAYIESDRVLIDPMWHDKGKFVVAGWNALGQYQISSQLFDSAELARDWLLSLDSICETVAVGQEIATVYQCFDKNYWWVSADGKKHYKLFEVCDLAHASKMAETSLHGSFASDGIPF
jgi:hypothetical protein